MSDYLHRVRHEWCEAWAEEAQGETPQRTIGRTVRDVLLALAAIGGLVLFGSQLGGW